MQSQVGSLRRMLETFCLINRNVRRILDIFWQTKQSRLIHRSILSQMRFMRKHMAAEQPGSLQANINPHNLPKSVAKQEEAVSSTPDQVIGGVLANIARTLIASNNGIYDGKESHTVNFCVVP